MPIKSYKKPELKEAKNQKPLQKSPYKQEIGKYFNYTLEYDFLDVVAEILDRIDFSIKDATDDDTDYEEDLYEKINQAIDDALTYTADRWTIFEFYVADPSEVDEYTWMNCIEEFSSDIYGIVKEIKGEEPEADDIEVEDEEDFDDDDYADDMEDGYWQDKIEAKAKELSKKGEE